MISITLLLISSTIYAVSVDCTNMIELASGLGMQTAQPAIWTALQSDCCNATRTEVYCDGSQRVWQINWDRIGLNGVINVTAIPSRVTRLYLNRNDITGSIPNALPSGLHVLDLSGNQMSGDLPPFPSTLQYLYLGYPGDPGNRFTGSLRLNRPIGLYINDNWITDVFIQDSSVLATSGYSCDLSNNPLLGNPNIAVLSVCIKGGLYSAALLPVTRITLITTTIRGMHLTSSGITANETTTTNNAVGTVQFVQILSAFAVNLGMMVRIVISAMLLTFVISRAPFKREFKRMIGKEKTTTTTSGLEF